MSGNPVFHIEVLNEAQKNVLPSLGNALSETEFYLAGGTALALQLGHRSSVDFDWFTPKLGDPETFLQRLKSLNIRFEIQSISFETIYLDIDNVQLSFMGYDYQLLRSKILWPEYGLYFAHMDDIACMKLSAIASRGSRKDFFDLHYLIKHYLPLAEYLRLYTKKYENRDIGHVIRSLVYFDDAEAEPELKLVKPTSWEALKRDFENWVKDLKV